MSKLLCLQKQKEFGTVYNKKMNIRVKVKCINISKMLGDELGLDMLVFKKNVNLIYEEKYGGKLERSKWLG